jgi:hypothetical protein
LFKWLKGKATKKWIFIKLPNGIKQMPAIDPTRHLFNIYPSYPNPVGPITVLPIPHLPFFPSVERPKIVLKEKKTLILIFIFF